MSQYMARKNDLKKDIVHLALGEQTEAAHQQTLETTPSAPMTTHQAYRRKVFNMKKKASETTKFGSELLTTLPQNISTPTSFPQVEQ